MPTDRCLNRVATGAAVGGALGGSIGTCCRRVWREREARERVGGRGLFFFTLHPTTPPGALYGTYEAFRYKVPGLYKLRYVGQTTLSSAAVFGLFLGAGSLLHCGRGQGY